MPYGRDDVPDQRVPLLKNLLGLGIPGAKARLQSEREELAYDRSEEQLTNTLGPELAQLYMADPVLGRQMAQQAMQRPGEASYDIGVPSPKDFTTDSLAAYQQTGDPRDLIRYESPQAQRRLQQAEERLEMDRLRLGRMPESARAALVDQQLIVGNMEEIDSMMSQDYFGKGFDFVGETEEEIRRRFTGDPSQTLYWSMYRTWRNDLLASTAGKNMTQSEKELFFENTLRPSDSPPAAAVKWEFQKRLAQAKYRQMLRSLRGQQYVIEGMDESGGPAQQGVDLQSIWDATGTD